MKTLIAIPCFDTVNTEFMQSVVDLAKTEGTSYSVLKNTLIYVARNVFAGNAVQAGFDRILWFDSDMIIPKNALEKLSEDMDKGYDLVTGLYFTRRPPIKPNIFERMWWNEQEDGSVDAGAKHYWTYPENELIPIEACGFGCCMTSVDLIKRIGDKFGSPFTPLDGVGEDLSFCWRATQIGAKMCADTSVKCGHIGFMVYDEDYYKKQGVPEHED